MAKIQKAMPKAVAHLETLEDISTLISHSEDLQEALRNVVGSVVERMATEVCSIYLFDNQKSRLILCATMGVGSGCRG